MLARLKSEVAYARGILGALKRLKPVAEHPRIVVGDYLERWAKTYGDRPALIGESETLSYRALDARANRYARWARSIGVSKGDVVGLLMANCPDYVAIWMGIARAGGATALLNTNLNGAALAHGLKIVNAKAVIVEASLLAQYVTAQPYLDPATTLFVHGATPAEAPRIDVAVGALDGGALALAERPTLTIDDAALYISTSGTTGMPKAARITHSRVLRIMLGFAAATQATADDRIYDCLPMYHTNGGVVAPGIALAVGGACVIRPRFSASEFWRDAAEARCTLFIYVGELCRYLMNTPRSPSDRAHDVRLCVGNGLRPDIFAAFQKRFGIREVREFYAATEGNAAIFNFDSFPGAVGRLPGWAAARFPARLIAFDVDAETERRGPDGRCIPCKTGEIGELIAEILDDPKQPAAQFDGYADPEATRRKILRDVLREGDAWFRTGDLLRQDARGYFYFVDRIGDTFRWKGENVSTTEVAETIMLFPQVQEAIVYGVAVAGHDGRAGMAALVVDSVAAFDLDGLRAFLADRLPAYARPAFLRFRDTLELTGTFKPRKVDLMREGFDASRVADPIFLDDRASAYRRVDAATLAALNAGAMRL